MLDTMRTVAAVAGAAVAVLAIAWLVAPDGESFWPTALAPSPYVDSKVWYWATEKKIHIDSCRANPDRVNREQELADCAAARGAVFQGLIEVECARIANRGEFIAGKVQDMTFDICNQSRLPAHVNVAAPVANVP